MRLSCRAGPIPLNDRQRALADVQARAAPKAASTPVMRLCRLDQVVTQLPQLFRFGVIGSFALVSIASRWRPRPIK